MKLETIFTHLATCESLAEVDATLRVAAAQGVERSLIRGMREDEAQRLGGVIVQEILQEVGLV